MSIKCIEKTLKFHISSMQLIMKENCKKQRTLENKSLRVKRKDSTFKIKRLRGELFIFMIGRQENSSKTCHFGRSIYSIYASAIVLRSLIRSFHLLFRCTQRWLTSGWLVLMLNWILRETCSRAENWCFKGLEITKITLFSTLSISDSKQPSFIKSYKEEKSWWNPVETSNSEMG